MLSLPYRDIKHFHHPRTISHAPSQSMPPPAKKKKSPLQFLSSLISFTYSRTSYIWNRTVCTHLFLASSRHDDVSDIHSCCFVYQQFVSFYCWIVFHPLVNGHLIHFKFSHTKNKDSMNFPVKVFFMDTVLIFLG